MDGSRVGIDHACGPAPHAMAQEALANPRRQRRGAAPALRGERRREGACYCGAMLFGRGQWSSHRRRPPTLMRHEVGDAAVEDGGVISGGVMVYALPRRTLLAPFALTARTRRVGQAAGTTALVTAYGRTS